MEILEILFVAFQGCGCVLESLALGSTAGTGVAGYKARKNHVRNRKVRERWINPDAAPPSEAVSELPLRERQSEPPPSGRSNLALIAFLILLPVSILLIVLVTLRYTR